MTRPDAHPSRDSSPDPDARVLLRRVVQLACDNADAGRLPFGALVVRDGDVLATGVNSALRDRDPTAHAYAAPRQFVPDLQHPAPPDNAGLMARMQEALRTTAPDQLRYVETAGADAPFLRFLANRAGR